MTIEMLAELGANAEEGVKRCAGNEAFYLKMISKALEAERYNKLEEKIREKDMDYTDLINEMRENRDIFVKAMGREESIND